MRLVSGVNWIIRRKDWRNRKASSGICSIKGIFTSRHQKSWCFGDEVWIVAFRHWDDSIHFLSLMQIHELIVSSPCHSGNNSLTRNHVEVYYVQEYNTSSRNMCYFGCFLVVKLNVRYLVLDFSLCKVELPIEFCSRILGRNWRWT